MMKPAVPADYLLAKSYSLPSSAEKSTKLLVNEYYHGNNQIRIQLEHEVFGHFHHNQIGKLLQIQTGRGLQHCPS